MLPGGFGQSPYLVEQLRQRYPYIHIMARLGTATGQIQPISRGALLRYHDIEERGMPSEESFGISQTELYDAKIHPDATYCKGDEMGNGRICQRRAANPNVVEKFIHDPSKRVVYWRWRSILDKGAEKIPGRPVETNTWQICHVDVKTKELEQDIFWSEQAIARSTPIYTIEGPLTTGMEPFGKPLVIDLPDLGKLGFKMERHGGAEKRYKFYYRLRVKCNGANITMQFDIAGPRADVEVQPNGDYHFVSTDEIVHSHEIAFVDASCSPFVREGN